MIYFGYFTMLLFCVLLLSLVILLLPIIFPNWYWANRISTYFEFVGSPVVSNNTEFKQMFNSHGLPKMRFKIKPGTELHSLDFVHCLYFIHIGDKCRLGGLTNLTDVFKLSIGKSCELSGMGSLANMKGLSGGKNCIYRGLKKLNSLESAFIGHYSSLYDLDSLPSLSDELISGCINEGVRFYHRYRMSFNRDPYWAVFYNDLVKMN